VRASGRYILFDCISDHPTTLAGILHVAFHCSSRGSSFKARRQFPRARIERHCRASRGLRSCEIELVVASPSARSLPHTLHHAVFDSIMHHFHVCPRPLRPREPSPAPAPAWSRSDDCFTGASSPPTISSSRWSGPKCRRCAGIDIVNLLLLSPRPVEHRRVIWYCPPSITVSPAWSSAATA